MVCPICLETESSATAHPTKDAYQINCKQCGSFLLSRTAEVNLKSIPNVIRWRISAALRQQEFPVVKWEDVERAEATAVPGLLHRALRMLRALNERFPNGGSFSLTEVRTELIAVGWNKDASGARYMLEQVLEGELGYLRRGLDGNSAHITPRGLLHLEGVGIKESQVGFCAMWFSDEVNSLWASVIEPAIQLAGYQPLRIDTKPHNGKIDDEIMASIRGSRFVVADFTGNRGGVYYEAGFAHGLGLPVIFMCRDGDELHFDIRQYNCIFWSPAKLDDAQTRLLNRIRATLGQGPLRLS